MTTPPVRPPRLARVLLRLRRLGPVRQEIEADLDDLFQRRLASSGGRVARRRYWKDVISVSVRVRRGPIPAGGSGRSPAAAVWQFAQTAVQDLVHAVRLFRHQPAALATAVGGLGVSLAAATCIFSILNTAVLRPAGVADPAALVRVMRTFKNGTATTLPFDEYRDLRARARTVTLEAVTSGATPVEIAIPGRTGAPQFATVSFVSGSFFGTFGASMHAGRGLTPADDVLGAPPAVVVSYSYWQRRFAGDPAVVGTPVVFNGTAFAIVGVAGRSFRGPTVDPPPYWAPLSTYGEVYSGRDSRQPPRDVNVWGALASTATVETAQAELQAFAAARLAGAPNPDDRVGVSVDSTTRFATSDRLMVLVAVGLVFLAIGLILFLACANLANLLLAHATTRSREISLRLALGATRLRLIRQLLTEGFALAALSGLLGWLIALWTLPALVAAGRFSPTLDFSPDVRVYLFLAGASLLVGLGAGLLPALHGTRGQLAAPLRAHGGSTQTSRRSRRLRTLLVGLQAGACVVMIVLGALLTRSVLVMTHLDLGIKIDTLIVVSPELDAHGYDAPRAGTFLAAGLERIRGLPGIHSAALALNPPHGNRVWNGTVNRDGRSIPVHFNAVSPEYFETIGLRLVSGRSLSATDATGKAPSVVVSAAVARAIGASPIGADVAQLGSVFNHATIVGVVADAMTANVLDRDGWDIYQPIEAKQQPELSIVVRTAGDPRASLAPLQDAVRAIDPAIRIEPKVVADLLDDRLQEVRTLAMVANTLGALALCLAVTGIYGVTAYTVSQRTREIGVRLAVGATSAQILGQLVREGLRPIVIGLVIGAAAAAGAGRLMSSLLAGLSVTDPVSFAAAIGLLGAAALVAILVPARRAMRLDPAGVLRD